MSNNPQTPVAAPPVIDAEVAPAEERGHHEFGMSKLNYISDCPGWVSAESSEQAQKAAAEGTLLHNIMEAVLREWIKLSPKRPLAALLGEVINANPVEDAQYEYLTFCCKELELYINRPGAQVFLEQEVTITNPDGSKLNHGFLDVLVILGDVGVILDYKFGWIMVRLAAANKQGLGYALGTFQRYAALKRVGIIFIQPKLHSITKHVVSRQDIPRLYSQVRNTIDLAIAFKKDPAKHEDLLNPCESCTYCDSKTNCPVGRKHLLAVTRSIAPLSIPDMSGGIERIQTPEQAALCRYAIEVAEEFIDGIKARAREIAEANDGVIEAILPSGETVRYEIENRRMDRVLGGTLDIVEALSPIIEPQRLFGAAEFSLGTLQKLVAGELYENNNTPLAEELAKGKAQIEAEVAAEKITKTEGKKQVAELRKRLGETKITREEAAAQFEAILSAQGLLSRPDGEIKALRRKQTTAKQLV